MILNPVGYTIWELIIAYGLRLVFDSIQSDDISYAYTRMVMVNLKTKTFEPNFFCEVEIPACNHNKYEILERDAYAEKVLADKPDIIKDNNFINNLYDEIQEDLDAGVERETILVYHFSDFHWNMDYTEGTSNDCGEIVCCKPGQAAKTDEEKAGKWGDYKCDANPRVLSQVHHTMDITGTPDMVLWTGDSPDHGIYKDPRITTNATIQITEMIEKYSPETTVFPIHGNHEFDPMNTQDFNLEVDPVIELVSQAWSHWLSEEALEEYRTNTFFSMKVGDHPNVSQDFKKKMNNTRIIAYNSQDCYIYNFYIIGQMNDPGQQFEWLENLLRQMEKDGEVAIFIGHMSPGTSDCASEVSSRLRVLSDRFQHIIRLNLFGHTHDEEFEVIRSVGDDKPIGVNHLTSSMTTFIGRNPCFRVITLDAKTKLPLKIETFSIDIGEANKDDAKAQFTRHHELTEEYEMKDLSPNSFLNLADRFKSDSETCMKYKANMFAGGPGFLPGVNSCSDSARSILSCHTANSVFSDARACMNWADFLDIEVLESILFDLIIGRWVAKK